MLYLQRFIYRIKAYELFNRTENVWISLIIQGVLLTVLLACQFVDHLEISQKAYTNLTDHRIEWSPNVNALIDEYSKDGKITKGEYDDILSAVDSSSLNQTRQKFLDTAKK